MATIHHATLKRAEKLGVRLLEVPEGGFRLADSDNRISVETWDSAKEALDELVAEHVTWSNPYRGLRCGVMGKSYHDRYEANPHGPGCGDGLDVAMRDAVTTEVGVDLVKLKRIGDRHNLWNPLWERLNPGMQRMNLTNRLRAFLRNNADAVVDLEGTTPGRFGVAYQPAARKARKLEMAA